MLWDYLYFWMAHIAEGNDILAHMFPKLHSDLGRTVRLMIQMYEPLFYMGKNVVMDSGFCVANGIFALMVKGVCAGALFKKCWY